MLAEVQAAAAQKLHQRLMFLDHEVHRTCKDLGSKEHKRQEPRFSPSVGGRGHPPRRFSELLVANDRDTPVRLSTEAETMCTKEIFDQEKKTDIRSAWAESLTGV